LFFTNWPEAVEEWKKLYTLRQFEMKNLKQKKVCQLFKEWPVLKNHLGHELVKLTN
jgi:hypothetical protein